MQELVAEYLTGNGAEDTASSEINAFIHTALVGYALLGFILLAADYRILGIAAASATVVAYVGVLLLRMGSARVGLTLFSIASFLLPPVGMIGVVGAAKAYSTIDR